MKNVLYLIPMLVIVISACKKEETNTKTKIDLLTQKNWKCISIIDLNDGMDLFKPCNTDDLYTYTSKGIFYYNPGSNKCSSETSATLDWNFFAGEDSLKVGISKYSIRKLTEDTLTLGSFGYIELKFVH